MSRELENGLLLHAYNDYFLTFQTTNSKWYLPLPSNGKTLSTWNMLHIWCAKLSYMGQLSMTSLQNFACVYTIVYIFPLHTMSLTFKISCFKPIKVKCKFAFRAIVGKLLLIRLSNFTCMYAIMDTTIVTLSLNMTFNIYRFMEHPPFNYRQRFAIRRTTL